jgi:hypothetical protein
MSTPPLERTPAAFCQRGHGSARIVPVQAAGSAAGSSFAVRCAELIGIYIQHESFHNQPVSPLGTDSDEVALSPEIQVFRFA